MAPLRRPSVAPYCQPVTGVLHANRRDRSRMKITKRFLALEAIVFQPDLHIALSSTTSQAALLHLQHWRCFWLLIPTSPIQQDDTAFIL